MTGSYIKELTSEACDLIAENFKLLDLKLNVIEFTHRQEGILEKFEALGYTRARFFEEAQAKAVKDGRIEFVDTHLSKIDLSKMESDDNFNKTFATIHRTDINSFERRAFTMKGILGGLLSLNDRIDPDRIFIIDHGYFKDLWIGFSGLKKAILRNLGVEQLQPPFVEIIIAIDTEDQHNDEKLEKEIREYLEEVKPIPVSIRLKILWATLTHYAYSPEEKI